MAAAVMGSDHDEIGGLRCGEQHVARDFVGDLDSDRDHRVFAAPFSDDRVDAGFDRSSFNVGVGGVGKGRRYR